jgi:dolichol-phosphate mannosyltransferase
MNALQRSEIVLGVVCPMANECDTAVEFVKAVLSECAEFESVTFFAILDNICKDGTVELLREMQKDEGRLDVVWSPENRCVVDAYLRGYREALGSGCDWILEIDAGFSHRPEQIPDFFAAMDTGLDCAFGSRFCDGGKMDDSAMSRRVISGGGTVLANILLGTKLKDMTSGFEIFTRETLEMVLAKGIKSRGHFFQTEIKAFCRKLRFAEIPIQYSTPSDSISGGVLIDAFGNLLRLVWLRITGKL